MRRYRNGDRPALQTDAAEQEARALEERAAACARTAAIYGAAHQVLLNEARRVRQRPSPPCATPAPEPQSPRR
jgi:hypothetical protein